MNCSWCGKATQGVIEVEPAVRARDKRTGAMVEKRKAVTAPACDACKRRIESREGHGKPVTRAEYVR